MIVITDFIIFRFWFFDVLPYNNIPIACHNCRPGPLSRCYYTWICIGWEGVENEQIFGKCCWSKDGDWGREKPKGMLPILQQFLCKLTCSWREMTSLHFLWQENPPYSADVLRLWVSSVDYTGDMLIGPQVLRQMSDIYRKLRGTLRFLLANLHDWKVGYTVSIEAISKWKCFRTYSDYTCSSIFFFC